MGQYYKTSKPTFVDDFMYKPPYELYKEVIQSKDKQIDEGLASTADLDKYLNFNSLEFDQQEAENEKLKYISQIEDLSNKIKQDPINFQKYSQDIYKLQKDLNTNYTTGKIGVIRGDYDKYIKFEEDHKKFKEKDAARYTAGRNAFYEEARKRRQDPNGVGYKESVWDSEQLQETKDFRKGFLDAVKQMRPDVTPINSSSAKGGYLFQVNGTKEVLSEEQVVNLMRSYITSTPNIEDYLRQSERIKLPEDFAGLEDFAKQFAYSKNTTKQTIKEDQYGLINARSAAANALENKKQKNREKLVRLREELKGRVTPGMMGEVSTNLAINMFGKAGVSTLNTNTKRKIAEFKKQGYTDQEIAEAGYGTIRNDQIVNYGIADLASKGIISTKTADINALQKRIQQYSQTLGSFGKKQLVFTFPKNVVAAQERNGKKFTTSYNAGETYIMTVDQAKKVGLIKNVVKNSGEPFYVDENINGVRYKFEGANGVIEANLMPTGSLPGLTQGIKFIDPEE